MQASEAVLVGDRGAVAIGDVEKIHRENRSGDRDVDPIAARGENAHRLSARQHVGRSLDRVIGVDRYIGTAGLDDRVHTHEQIDRTSDREPDVGLGPYTQ
ncbi:unannotated protein [freshwater metagenome]|uniref:Unannotated protein n=1 Tax=freshwater metagenome TaxID=449393 RepID=A0A6J7IY63_9ZZZZ